MTFLRVPVSLFLRHTQYLPAFLTGCLKKGYHLSLHTFEKSVLENFQFWQIMKTKRDVSMQELSKSNRIGFVQLWKFGFQNEALGAKWRQLNGGDWRQLQVSQTETNWLGTGVWSRSASLPSCVWSKCHSGPSTTAAHLSRTLTNTYSFLISQIKESPQAVRPQWRSQRWAGRYFAKASVVSLASWHKIWKVRSS